MWDNLIKVENIREIIVKWNLKKKQERMKFNTKIQLLVGLGITTNNYELINLLLITFYD